MIDDTGVPVIAGMPTKDGWRTETLRVKGRAVDIFVSPDGTRYAVALSTERADLIVRSESLRFKQPLVVRFRLQQTSNVGKQIRQEERADAARAKTKHVRRKK